MAIVKTIEINASLGQSKQNIQDLNEQLEIQRQVLIDLEKELLKVEEVRKQTAKTDLQAQKQLKERSEFLKTEIQNEKLGLRELNSERRTAISETQSYVEETVKSSKIIAALDKLTDGYATKIVKLYKGFGESTKAVGGFIGGLSGIQKAIVATGIGALVVGVGLLIANWDKLSKAVSGATAESKAYKEAQSEIISAVSKVQAEITRMGDTIELAKQGTISKEEALRQYNDALGESVGYAESLEQAESLLVKNANIVIEVTKLKAQQEILYAEAAQMRAKVIAGDETLKPGWWESVGNAVAAAFSPGVGGVEFATKQVKSYRKNVDETIKTAEQLEGSAAKVAEEIAKLQEGLEKGSLSPKEREKRNAQIKDLQKKADDDAIKNEKEKAAALESIRQALIDTENERRNEELEKINKHYEEQIRLAEEYYGKETQKVKDLRQAQKNAYDAQQNEFYAQDAEAAIARDEKNKLRDEEASKKAAEKLALDKENDLLSFEEQRAVIAQREALLLQDKTINEKDRTDLEKTYSDKRKEIDQLEADFKKSQAQEIGDSLTKLGELAGKETVAGKALGIAAATINTFQGATEALKQKSTLPSPFDVVAKVANVATVIATGLKTVKSIAAVKVPGGGGGGSVPSAPSLPAAQPPAFNVVGQGGTNQLAQVIGEQTQQPIQTYVVANDITSAQSLQRNIQSEAGIGG